jgi:hypothetical protein
MVAITAEAHFPRLAPTRLPGFSLRVKLPLRVVVITGTTRTAKCVLVFGERFAVAPAVASFQPCRGFLCVGSPRPRMDLQSGNWVRTETGLRGRVTHISRLTAFVEVEVELDGGVELLPFLLSELTRIERPEPEGANPSLVPTASRR